MIDLKNMTIKLISLFAWMVISACTTMSSTKQNKLYLGYFTYMADAALFVDCLSHQSYSVQALSNHYNSLELKTDAYLSLEQYYLNHQKSYAQPLYLKLHAISLKKTPQQEGWHDVLIPISFKQITKIDSGCRE